MEPFVVNLHCYIDSDPPVTVACCNLPQYETSSDALLNKHREFSNGITDAWIRCRFAGEFKVVDVGQYEIVLEPTPPPTEDGVATDPNKMLINTACRECMRVFHVYHPDTPSELRK